MKIKVFRDGLRVILREFGTHDQALYKQKSGSILTLGAPEMTQLLVCHKDLQLI